jgi:hypothetical protein
MRVDARGRLWVTDPYNNRVQRFTFPDSAAGHAGASLRP